MSTVELLLGITVAQRVKDWVKRDLLALRPLILALYPLVCTLHPHTRHVSTPRQGNDVAVCVCVCVCV